MIKIKIFDEKYADEKTYFCFYESRNLSWGFYNLGGKTIFNSWDDFVKTYRCLSLEERLPLPSLGEFNFAMPNSMFNLDETREKLAELCRKQRSCLMRYLFSQVKLTKRVLKIPVEAIERWERQLNIPYSRLSDEEKESDRKEADKFIPLLMELNENEQKT